ncbi:hypothetical protein JHK85_004817 [Glycine max]|nr:hypothetical protein JHK85_004817 [Glycine max]
MRKLARCFPTAIVTGRCKDKDSKAEPILCQPANDFLPLIDEVYQQLVEKTKSTPGALVENNKFCLSVHFRCVDEKVLEICPTIKWDKGKALELLLESLGERQWLGYHDLVYKLIKLKVEISCLSDQVEQKEMLRNELELINKSLEESEAQLQSRTVESNELVSQIALLKKEAERSLDELNRMKNLKYEKELAGRVLQSELEALRTQYNDLKSYLLGDEVEKENVRKQVFQLKAFSNNLKIGLDEDSQNKTKLAELLRLSQDGRIRDANKVLNEMTESKIEAQNITSNTLINAYYKFGELKSTLKFKNKLLEAGLKRDPFTYKALIHGFYKTNELERENELMFSMVDTGFTPSYCTFSWIGDGYNMKDNMDAVLALPDVRHVLDLMRIGQKNRVVGATGLNERSTHSHSVLTVHVRGRELVSNSIVKGCVDVVDLAELDQCKAGNYQNMGATGLKMTRHQKRKIDETHVEAVRHRYTQQNNAMVQTFSLFVHVLQCVKEGIRVRCAHEGCNIYEAISIFEEFTGPKYNLPWFRLTPEAAEIDRDKKRVYEECREDLRSRLRNMILMTREHVLPLKIIQGMQWYLGLPSDFLQHPEQNLDESFRFVDMEDGLKGLALDSGEKIYSLMEKNATNRDKRLVGVLHELLSLFVEHSAERKKLFCLKKYFGLPQKVHRAFERHPHMFYISFRNKTCTVILKETYSNKSAIEKHPLLRVRKKYIKLMKKWEVILRNRRVNNRFSNCNAKLDIDSNDLGEKGHEM